MKGGSKGRWISVPFQVASRLPMASTSTPLVELMAKVVTGEFETKRGAAILRSTAQRFSEVQVTAEAGAGLAIVAGGGFDLTAAGTVGRGRGTIGSSLLAVNGFGPLALDD